MKKIICVHLYNDFSGSPLVLSNVIKSFLKQGKKVELLSSNSEGFLSELSVPKKTIPYRFNSNRWLRLLWFLWSQWSVFLTVLTYRKEASTIYINTLLPFGAAIAGKLTGKQVIYHIHETSIRPVFLKQFLKWVASMTANKTIYVSNYLKKVEYIPRTDSTVVYNALSSEFVKEAKHYLAQNIEKRQPFTILMLCSLKAYKGVDPFVEMAQKLPNCKFKLVLNASMEQIKEYFKEANIPENLVIFPKQKNVHWFYQHAHLVVNLSNPKQWVETFGMTLLEAMNYRIPVIAPSVGGPTEVVQDGVNGYLINSDNLPKIVDTIQELVVNNSLYQQLANNAERLATFFSQQQFQEEIIDCLNCKIATKRNGRLVLADS